VVGVGKGLSATAPGAGVSSGIGVAVDSNVGVGASGVAVGSGVGTTVAGLDVGVGDWQAMSPPSNKVPNNKIIRLNMVSSLCVK
jgi:hypothetical protein